MKMHVPQNYPDFPPEKGKSLSPKMKLLMHTTREVVLGMVDEKKSIPLKKYKKDISELAPRKKLPKAKALDFSLPEQMDTGTASTKALIKSTIHQALDAVDITPENTQKRITKALETLGGQYARMSPERFFHRLENGKVFRDTKFLISMIRTMSQIGDEGVRSILEILLRQKGNYHGLTENSRSMRSLSQVFQKAKIAFALLPPQTGTIRTYKDFSRSVYGLMGTRGENPLDPRK